MHITRAVFDGLEFISRSGVTNMLDRPVVLNLAKEWGFPETAEWIERVDTKTYARLIFEGPEVIESGKDPQVAENDPLDQLNIIDILSRAIDDERAKMRDIIAMLGRQAVVTLAETYETDLMGVLIDSPHEPLINVERTALIARLAETSSLWQQFDEVMREVQRGIGSLQYLIDPENS